MRGQDFAYVGQGFSPAKAALKGCPTYGSMKPTYGSMKEDSVRRLLTGAIVVTAMALGPAAPLVGSEASAERDQKERAFVQGGQIYMDLSAGGYSIAGTDDSRIRVKWTTEDPADMHEVQVSIGVDGKAARIDTDGPSNNFRVEIEVPKRSDLTIRLSAGEITVSGIEGHKDVSAWAGELKLGVGRAADYRSADASVTAGEIQAAAFDVTKEGLFRSFTKDGKGKYDLKVRLTAGKIVLSEDEKPAAVHQP